MPRYRRTLEDALKEMSGQSRTVAGLSLATPALDVLDTEYIKDGSITANQLAFGAVQAVHMGENAVRLENLEQELQDNLGELNVNVDLVDDKIAQAITDSEAKPITSDRFNENSWDIWPFVENTIPSGALAPGAVGSSDLADFAVTVKNIRDDRHRLY